MTWEETREFLSPCFPEHIRSELELLQPGELREIRIRADRATVFVTASRTALLDWQPGQRQLEAVVEALSGHSLYAREDETAHGFITLEGGHRMGLCGRIVTQGNQRAMTDIGSVCIRIAAQWPGAADRLLRVTGSSAAVLVIGPPGSGKTTLLRDLARQLSTGRNARQVAVIDERGELGACLCGVPQLDLGSSDVLDGLPRTEAVPWLVRSMAPEVIVTDELASREDAACLLDASASGVSVCASIHGRNLHDAAARPAGAELMARRIFSHYAVLAPEGGGRIIALHDQSGSPLPLP